MEHSLGGVLVAGAAALLSEKFSPDLHEFASPLARALAFRRVDWALFCFCPRRSNFIGAPLIT